MSDQEAVDQAEPRDAPMGESKKVSGLLIISIMLTGLGIVMFLPLLGPVAGLITAFVAKRKIRVNPLLIGPRFANFCVIAALLAIPVNIWFGVIGYDRHMLGTAAAEKYFPVVQGLMERDLTKSYEGMDESFRNRVTPEEYKARFAGFLPGTEPIPVTKDTLFTRDDEIEKELGDKLEQIRKGDLAELEFNLPWKIKHGEIDVGVDMLIWIRRVKWAEYEARVFDIHPIGTAPAVATPDGATGTGKAPESAPEDEPK